MKSKLAIFDLDGTLFDTRLVNFHSYRQALSEEGYELSLEFYETECNGKHYKSFFPLIVKNPTEELMESVHIRKKQLYPEFLSKVTVNDHLFQIAGLISPEYHIAIVTTASRENCLSLLDYFGKKEMFELIIAQEDVTKTKPDPEGLLKAMCHFGITKENTIVFEDSDTGIKAAKQSGAGVLVTLEFG